MKKPISLLLLGVILPDVIARVLDILLPHQSIITWIQSALHTPVALISASLLLSFLFSQKIRKTVFLFLVSGVFLHLFLDFLQKTLKGGYLWLFPFSFATFSIPLIWPNDSVFLIPLLLILNFIYYKKTYKSKKY